MNNHGQEQRYQLQWYPGHMAKWDREFNTHLQTVDVVIEVLDARMPLMSRHMDIRERVKTKNKPLVTVLNKKDLADKRILQDWLEYFQSLGEEPIAVDAQRDSQAKNALVKAVQAAGKPAQDRWVSKGLKARAIRTMIMGMPNVGKSSLINGLIGKKKVHTGHKAGVTRQTQWVRVHPQVELLDSPGILPPKLERQDDAHWLALVSSIGENAFDDQEVARFCLDNLVGRYEDLFCEKYGMPATPEEPWSLERIAEQDSLLKAGGELDIQRAAHRLITDIRQGKLGHMCFETPPKN